MSEPGVEKKFRLPRNVIALGFVSLFTDISSEMLYPIIPLFLRETLKTPMWAIGVVEGAADGISSLLRGLSGWLSDKFKRRKIFVVIGYGASALAKPITALAQSWGFVLATRALDRFGKSIRTSPRDALISAQVGEANRGYAFGFHRAMDTTGAVIGPALALLLIWRFGLKYQSLFYLAVIPAAIGVLIAWLVVREVRESEVKKKAVLPTLPGQVPAAKWLNPPLKRFLIVTGLFALANSSNTFIILRARDVFHSVVGPSGADALAIAGYILFNFSFALLAAPVGHLSDRLGRKKIIVAGYLTYALVYGLLAFVANAYTIWGILFVYGIYEALTHGVTRALVADLAPSEYRGTALGTVNAIDGVGTLAAGIFMGYLWDVFGPALAFSAEAVIAVAAAVLLMVLRLTPVPVRSDR